MVIESSYHTRDEQGITLPITTEYRKIAQQFSQQCPFPDKTPQIKQNTLAVCAVNAYLQLMDITTSLGESDSWNPMMQMMADVADLKVPGVGVFSCRAIAPQATTCYVPPEDWHSRAGYIAVAIDEAANQATLLGFMPTVDEIEQVPLDRFNPIENLLDRVHSLRAIATASNASNASNAITHLNQWNQWIQDTAATGWQAAAALIAPPELNFAFRASERVSSATSATDISRAKLIDLGLQLGTSLQVALVIHLAPASDSRSDIVIQIRPLGDSACLPEGVLLAVFDETDTLFRSATSRAIDNYIQIQIMGCPGETFSIQVSKGEAIFIERFVI